MTKHVKYLAVIIAAITLSACGNMKTAQINSIDYAYSQSGVIADPQDFGFTANPNATYHEKTR